MSIRHTIYYLVSVYLVYIVYSLVKEINKGRSTPFIYGAIVFFSFAAIGIAIYTTILLVIDKKNKHNQDKIEKHDEQ